MMGIYPSFLTSLGFFAGLAFSLASPIGPMDMLLATIISTVSMYMLGLATLSLFTKHQNLQEGFNIRREHHESTLDNFILDIENKEGEIRDIETFIREFEREDLLAYENVA